MTDTVNNLYAQQYSENIMQLAQQSKSKLWNAVFQKTNVTGKVFYQDQIGEWSMSTKAGRNSDTPSNDPNLARRRGTMLTFNDNRMLDHSDELKILSDPRSAYTIAAGKSLGRQIDLRIINGLGADADTGEDGTTSVSLPAGQIIVDGGTGLTFSKVAQAQRIMNDNDVEDEDRFFVVSPAGIEDLMSEDRATSSDYTTLQAIQSGKFEGEWMGFQWIKSTLLDKTGDIRQCFAFHRFGICAGLSEMPMVRTDERADKNYSWQVYYELNIGTTRLEEDRVVRVDIDETA